MDSQMTQKTKNRKLCLLFKVFELSRRAVYHQCDKNQHSRSCEVHRIHKHQSGEILMLWEYGIYPCDSCSASSGH